jgi:predicted nucleotidyltransferase
MNYLRSLETVIPGVQGQVLGVLSRTGDMMTMRTVAKLAGVSPNRATSVLNNLVALGLVERKDVGRAALVGLIRENEAVKAILTLAHLSDTVIERLRQDAKSIFPSPASLVIFGSFARREASKDSDIDVLAVRPPGIRPNDLDWADSLGQWADRASRVTGNPVNLLETTLEELSTQLCHLGSVWETAARSGVLLAGEDLASLTK